MGHDDEAGHTHLVLCVIEQAGREGRESGFSRFAFADAGAANRAVSRDMSGVNASFAMADGSTLQGGAVAMQERYLQAVEQFVDEHPEVASVVASHRCARCASPVAQYVGSVPFRQCKCFGRQSGLGVQVPPV